VPSYLVETFLPRGGAEERPARERRAHSVAEELRERGDACDAVSPTKKEEEK
jgi:hypothetical protein